MNKTATVRARIQPKLKAHAEDIFERLGLNPTQAITIFYKQVELRGGLPFDMVIPTPLTRKTIKLTDERHDLVVCKDAGDMFKKLGL